jgi:hypothetical protein
MLDEPFEMEGYDAKRFGYFLGLVIGTAILVTVIYWAIFGFNRWEGHAPVEPATNFPSGTGQYICPQDGAVGLPGFDAAGCPHCPICGQVMGFSAAPPTNLSTVAVRAG